jgi:diacylglycerol O-acyltransferase
MKPLNILDVALLMMETPATPMHIGGVQILRLPKGAGKDFVHKLHEYVCRFPASGAPFNYRLASAGPLSLPFWQELDTVPLEEHVFHHALPWPGGEPQLLQLVSRLNSSPLNRSRPMWEHHLIEGLSGNRFATFTRIHHSMIDGQWGMRLAHATTSADRRARGLPPYWAVKFDTEAAEDEAPTAAPRTRGARKSIEHQESGGTLAELRKAFGRVVESFLHRSDDGLVPIYTAPASLLDGTLTARRELAVVALDLRRIKTLAHAHASTVNEIVLALCGGALRRYLSERNALPARPLIANIPIAVARPKGAVGGNAIMSGLVSLATHIGDPVARLEMVRGSSHRAKELLRDMPSLTAVSIYGALVGLPYLLAQATGNADKISPQNLVISNVAGPREKRYINGMLIEADYPISLLVPGQAMNITVISHADRLDVAVLVCPSLVRNPHRVTEAIAESLDELERALLPKHGAGPVAKKATGRVAPTQAAKRGTTKAAAPKAAKAAATKAGERAATKGGKVAATKVGKTAVGRKATRKRVAERRPRNSTH